MDLRRLTVLPRHERRRAARRQLLRSERAGAAALFALDTELPPLALGELGTSFIGNFHIERRHQFLDASRASGAPGCFFFMENDFFKCVVTHWTSIFVKGHDDLLSHHAWQPSYAIRIFDKI
jgi:hypothetical protein